MSYRGFRDGLRDVGDGDTRDYMKRVYANALRWTDNPKWTDEETRSWLERDGFLYEIRWIEDPEPMPGPNQV
jgi:hypothetical protein